MKVNKLKQWWIVVQSVWITFIGSLSVLFNGLIGKRSRKDIDKIINKWATRILNVIQLSYEISDPYQVTFDPNRSYIIMSNHASLYDIPLILIAFPHSVRMITKKELAQIPIWGHAMRAAELVPLDRENPYQAMKDLSMVQERMKSGVIPWIAPEGTRTRTGKLGSFKKGGFMIAQKTKAIIVPVGICGSYDVLPPKTIDFNVGAHVKIRIGKPIDSTKYAMTERKKLMQDVETSIRHLIEEPIDQ